MLDDDALLQISQQRGDAFALLVERHGDRLRSYLRHRVGSEQVDDALAELWEVSFRRRHSYDATLGSASGWLYGIARNVSYHQRRRGSRRHRLHQRLLVNDAGRRHECDPAERVVDLDSIERVGAAIETLPAHEREVVDLVVLGGLSYQSASELLDLPIGTVRSRLSRAKSRLWHAARLSDGVSSGGTGSPIEDDLDGVDGTKSTEM